MDFGFCHLSQHRVIMTSNYVIVPIKLYLDVGNDEHIILCNFGGRFVSSFEVMEGDPKAHLLVAGSKNKKPGLNRDKVSR